MTRFARIDRVRRCRLPRPSLTVPGVNVDTPDVRYTRSADMPTATDGA
jgi:hypothetical protein